MSEPSAPEENRAPDATSGQVKPGVVYTFYSYKGGVGRSMALVNVGVIMATQGLRVLLVDWDLEAPGLEVFFRKAATLRGDPATRPGVVDLLEARAAGTADVQSPLLTWRDCLLTADFAGHSLDIITAGSRSVDYRHRVQQLNWDALFREHAVGHYIDQLRDEWRQAYDMVLIDSRTGVTDIGDICTVLLPDVVVLLFVTNYQNVEGIKSVMQRAVQVRSKLPIHRSKLLGVPLPARDERDRESDKFEQWQKIFASEFDQLYREWLPKGVESSEALNRLYIPYIAAWSFGEAVPVLESPRERSDPSSIGAAYARLATLLAARLDWTAMDAKSSASDLASARLDASASREAARLAEEAQRRAEEELIVAQMAKDAAEAAASNARTVVRRRTTLAALAVGAAVAGVWWFNREPSVAALLSQLNGTDAEQQEAAIRALAFHRDVSDNQRYGLAPRVFELAKGPASSSLRFTALLYLSRFDAAGKYTQQVGAMFQDTDHTVRWGALVYYKDLAIGGAPEAGQVAALLNDTNERVRRAAVETLSALGPATARPYSKRIAALQEDKDESVRAAATKATQALLAIEKL